VEPAEVAGVARVVAAKPCVFCSIVAGVTPAAVVLDEPDVLAFLDMSPVFPGHVLIVPRRHFETLPDLPVELVTPLFVAAQRVAVGVRAAMEADGTWVSMNNTISQSVPHLHVHVVPRRRKDGLRGFYWPRQKYGSTDEVREIAARIAAAVPAQLP
jgi:histidine triad (HIT) family protein